MQTKVSLAISLFIFLSVNEALSIAFPYFVVVVNHNFAVFFFFMRGVKPRGWEDSIKHLFPMRP